MIIIIGRGHSGTRAISHTLSESSVYMGAQLNPSGDLVPAEEMYAACRVFGRYVDHLGDNRWDFRQALASTTCPDFSLLLNRYLESVLAHPGEPKGWKLPETTLVYPWIIRRFPDAHYIHWVRDPRDAILGSHLTDDLTDFGVAWTGSQDPHRARAISWLYQRAIVAATPPPSRCIEVRFEDFVLDQEATLTRLEAFLGIQLSRVEVRPDSVGRWRKVEPPAAFALLADSLTTLGYEG